MGEGGGTRKASHHLDVLLSVARPTHRVGPWSWVSFSVHMIPWEDGIIVHRKREALLLLLMPGEPQARPACSGSA